jgi:uncharacterized Zn-binding protein involved in type VI secretion
MPGPPPPFVPTPLPNIGQSSDRLSDCTTTVKIEGKKVAVKGSYYMSKGDMASKGTGGGILSAATHGKTEFTAPGSMNVKFEGKNVQLLGDAMTNNGSSKNTGATIPGNIQGTQTLKNIAQQLCEEFCKEVEANKKDKKDPLHSSYRFEQRLAKKGGFGKNVKFAPNTRGVSMGKITIPDATWSVGGEIRQCFDFKFPGDRWRNAQRERQRRMTKPRKMPIKISVKTCGC